MSDEAHFTLPGVDNKKNWRLEKQQIHLRSTKHNCMTTSLPFGPDFAPKSSLGCDFLYETVHEKQ